MEKVLNPDIRNFVNVTAHPAGCAQNVRNQVDYCLASCPGQGSRNALVIGSSAGYGLASMITAVFGYGAKGLGVCFEKPIKLKRTAAPGSYNIAALHRLAAEHGRYVETINGDAFSHAVRREAIAALQARYGKLDYVVYSIASSRRIDPDSGDMYKSCIKPQGPAYTTRTVDLDTERLQQVTVEPATPEETADTVRVMGGEDLRLWVAALAGADLLAPGCRIIAYTYIGSQATAPIYRSGTLGAAKQHLEQTVAELDKSLTGQGRGRCLVCACQALVTRASCVIPGMPLYLSLLRKAMEAGEPYETAIEQITRLFRQHLAPGATPATDAGGLLRLDARELQPAVQEYVLRHMNELDDDNWQRLADWQGFKNEFLRTAGFGLPGVDYSRGIDNTVSW